jgi:hypothetical protein
MVATIIWPTGALVMSLALLPAAPSQHWKGSAQPVTRADFVNPKVFAGNVHWHTSFESAREAAAKSGKLVLLFQMMGKLDDQFC